MNAKTLFLRLEGPMQAWGAQESKFLIRRTSAAPTKSGVIGLLCCALGLPREEARERLPSLSALRMGVRIDRPGVRWWDYHTVGAGMRMRIAKAKNQTKPGAMLTRREYLCDASFLVALQGDAMLIEELSTALEAPRWPFYLGRKSCPPSRPVKAEASAHFPGLLAALTSVPWQRRVKSDKPPETLDCLLDWRPTSEEPEAPGDADVWYDVPTSFAPPAHQARFVIRDRLRVGNDGDVQVMGHPAQQATRRPPRPRADYSNSKYREARKKRLDQDHHLCVFCKSPGSTVQHITYRRAGGGETQEDLRTLCRLCHDAVTMIEYGQRMGMDRINPEELRWRDQIIEKREEIIKFRSLETRRRRLATEEIE